MKQLLFIHMIAQHGFDYVFNLANIRFLQRIVALSKVEHRTGGKIT